MDYMTLKEAGEKWGVTPRWINYYCSAGRIPGAVKMGTVWLIQKDKTPSENWFCETEYLHTPDPDFDVCAKDNKVMPEMVDVARPMYCKDKR